MMKVIDNAKVPPGGKHVYTNPEDSHKISSPYFNQLRNTAKKYRQTNGFPVGLLWDEEFENNICANAADGVCFDWTPPSLADRASSLAAALSRHAKSGFRVVSKDEFERRIGICSECNFFGGMKGILKIVCKQCGCASKKASWSSEHCPLPSPKW